MQNTLLVFIRNPQLGKVKTRLASSLGDSEALRIYLILLEYTRRAALDCSAERMLFYSDFIPANDDWSPDRFHKKLQHSGDLGQRMEAAFQTAFALGAKKVVIIGSDCPQLTGTILDQAFELLETADFVLGPVPDGGYYLLGMKNLESALFYDINWSTETVLQKTLEKIGSTGKSYLLLPTLSDVDTAADWKAVQDKMDNLD